MLVQIWIWGVYRPGRHLQPFGHVPQAVNEQFLVVWQHTLSSRWARVMGRVLDLQGRLGRWLVSIGIRMTVRIQAFPAQYCTAARQSVLITFYQWCWLSWLIGGTHQRSETATIIKMVIMFLLLSMSNTELRSVLYWEYSTVQSHHSQKHISVAICKCAINQKTTCFYLEKESAPMSLKPQRKYNRLRPSASPASEPFTECSSTLSCNYMQPISRG